MSMPRALFVPKSGISRPDLRSLVAGYETYGSHSIGTRLNVNLALRAVPTPFSWSISMRLALSSQSFLPSGQDV